jgi:signal transduction histidine kinase
VAACKRIISALAERAGAERSTAFARRPAESLAGRGVPRWRDLRPRAVATLRPRAACRRADFRGDTTLEQGLLNLPNNAADAGSKVLVSAVRTGDDVTIEVRDNGRASCRRCWNKLAAHRFRACRRSGIGLFLAQAAIARLGGRLTLENDEGGVARVVMPLKKQQA